MDNPFMQPQQPMQMTIEAPRDMLDIIELRMEDIALAITRPLDPVVPHLTLIIDAPQVAQVEAIIAQVDKAASVRTVKLGDIDWVTQVQKDFPPFALGRFYVYGTHAKDSVPANHFPLLIDAVAAFGTGEHATTAGCLLALEALKRTRPHVDNVLDVGCGTAILGIGAARLWKNVPVEACDNDPMAVKVSRINLKANHIKSRSSAWVSDGYKLRPIQSLPKQEVIVANILARPLMKMARDAKRKLRGDGVLILSGLLNSQEAMVLAAHRAQGLYLKKRFICNRWK